MPEKAQKTPESSRCDRTFLVFQHTGEVIRAENLLTHAGFAVEVMGPPSWLRTGCDMVLVCMALQEPAVRRVLEGADLAPEAVYPLSDGMLSPVSLCQFTDFGDYFMVRAANMKVTVERVSGRIVNVSGGGCPDVPYLASLLVGESVASAREPREDGQTLCSYALQKACEEARRIWMHEHHG